MVRKLITRGTQIFISIVIVIVLFFIFKGLIEHENLSRQLDFKQYVQKIEEEAYYDGQRDAINNDIRIKKLPDGKWVWTKSPWDSGLQPIYDPSKEKSLSPRIDAEK